MLSFPDNASCHFQTLQNYLTIMKLIFLPKCAMFRLQPFDAGVITVLKCKYKKLLLKYVVSQIDEGKKTSEIIKDVNIAKAIHWLGKMC